MKLCDTKPCANCPWLKSTPAGGSSIPNFGIELMRNLKNTVPPRDMDDTGFYKVMACHKSTEGKQFACAGYMAKAGLDFNINARLVARDAELDATALFDATDKLDMYTDFYDMLDDYEAAQEGS
jgi:hypothetical protein